jgi:hypothetical protein
VAEAAGGQVQLRGLYDELQLDALLWDSVGIRLDDAKKLAAFLRRKGREHWTRLTTEGPDEMPPYGHWTEPRTGRSAARGAHEAPEGTGFPGEDGGAIAAAEEAFSGWRLEGITVDRELPVLDIRSCEAIQRDADGDLGRDLTKPVLKDTVVVRFLTARQSQGCLIQTLNKIPQSIAACVVIILGYMFDRPDVAEALIRAAGNRCGIVVVLDMASSLACKAGEQRSIELQLEARGIRVRLLRGLDATEEYSAVGRSGTRGFGGIQHAKAALVGNQVVLGSTNWTTASRANTELGALITVGESDIQMVRGIFWGFVRRSVPFHDAVAKHAQSAASREARKKC